MKSSKRRCDPHIIASFEISNATEVNLYFDFYGSKIWANIRKFAKSERYTGPTKDGVKFEPKYLPNIIKALEDADKRRDTMSDEIFMRLPKNKSADLIVHASSYKGTLGIDLRERFHTQERVEVWGKGIRLGVEYLADLIECIKLMSETKPNLKEIGPQTSFDFDNSDKKSRETKVEGVPDNLKEFFSIEEDNDEH